MRWWVLLVALGGCGEVTEICGSATACRGMVDCPDGERCWVDQFSGEVPVSGVCSSCPVYVDGCAAEWDWPGKTCRE